MLRCGRVSGERGRTFLLDDILGVAQDNTSADVGIFLAAALAWCCLGLHCIYLGTCAAAVRRVSNTREAGRFLIVQDELLMGVALLGGRQGSPDGGKGLAERGGGGVGTKR